MADVCVVGAGIGGLAAAMHLAGAGHRVTIVEADANPGGKANRVTLDGLTLDTGPSVLTMPDAFAEAFAACGERMDDHVALLRPDPFFRYLWPDGASLDVFHDAPDTLREVADKLGDGAAAELERFLAYARGIWDAAAPNFVLGDAPTPDVLLRLSLSTLGAVRHIDAFRTMRAAIEAHVRHPRLRDLLSRYATYNGSDPWQAPATLNCIAHVELGLGGFAVRGGIHALIDAMVAVATRRGVALRTGTRVERILAPSGRVVGVATDRGDLPADAVVINADAAHLAHHLLPDAADSLPPPGPPSMSGFNAILRIRRTPATPAPHVVLFPDDYRREFTDIFGRGQPPSDPTVYLCNLHRAHDAGAWPDAEPVFAMANAPPEPERGATPDDVWHALHARVLDRLSAAGLFAEGDDVPWTRTPTELAARYPGSRGAIYGASSNSRFAAFRRPPNRIRRVPGLYLCGGSAHPGGGMPLCAVSGRLAARALDADLGGAR